MTQNNKPIIDSLTKLIIEKSVSIYDFSILNTNTPQNKLIKTLNSVTDFAFKCRTQSKIPTNNYGIANWCKSSRYFVFDTNALKKAVEYLIRNCYFVIGDQVFQQINAILIGTDPAPFFLNHFEFCYQWHYINYLNKKSIISSRKFCHTFRFIDDLITINCENFEKNINNVLELKKENEIDKIANFSDFNIEVENFRFQTKLYDKRNNFGFNITRIPYKSRNDPNNN